MSEETHVESLKSRHAELEALIDDENGRPHPDDDIINQLKREKLRIKDQLFSIAH